MKESNEEKTSINNLSTALSTDQKRAILLASFPKEKIKKLESPPDPHERGWGRMKRGMSIKGKMK